jgi:hypothetical protein
VIPYAEQHFKFRLPWSSLSRPRPEMIVDAPCQVALGRKAPLWLVVRDAHLYPRRLREVRVTVRVGGQLHRQDQKFDLELNAPFHFITLPWPGPEISGENLVDVVFQVEDRKGRREVFKNHSLPGLPDSSLRVLRMGTDSPLPKGWACGDLHCHTNWSQDPVEFGGDPQMMREAANALGLDFFAATDHSYDFAWDASDYTVATDPEKAFARFRQSLPPDLQGEAVVLPAEEVSCGNHRGENVHLLVMDHPEYLPGQGDGGRRWFKNKPDLSLPEILARTLASGAPTFAAHPLPGITGLQRKIFRRGDYHPEDMHPGLTGLQFWNGHTGKDFQQGKDFWVRQAMSGNVMRPAAGNDAHGDLNRATYVQIPLFRLGISTRHRFGFARSCLFLGEGVGVERTTVRQAMKDAPIFLTDGPYLWIDAMGGLSARSTPEFGTWTEIVIYARVADQEIAVHRESSDATELHRRLDLPAGTRWIRAEGRTSLGRTALTQMVPLE